MTIGEPRIVGEIPFSPVFRIVRASARSLDACRTASAATVRVHLHLALGEIRLAVPAPDDPGPRAAATCVANRIAAAFPSGFEPETSGIIIVPVTLAAR